jgi:hypothetical protein
MEPVSGTLVAVFAYLIICNWQNGKAKKEKNRHREEMTQIFLNQISPETSKALQKQYGFLNYNHVINVLIDSDPEDDEIVWQNSQQEAIFLALSEGDDVTAKRLRDGE